ncbi:DNA repair protein RecO, partial [Candidatus Shapirobacteria bacterium]
MACRYFTTTAIVIKKHQLKESDLLITLLTPYQGKIVAMAKGVRNIKSHRLSSLQLGNTIKAQIYKKNNYQWLSEAKTTNSFLKQPKNLVQSNLLFYFLEILNQLIAENQQIENIYPISQNIIKSIQG